jgi:Family of unknown function (DUF6527)
MKLTDLNPRWCGHGGEGVTYGGKPIPLRERVGFTFNCPCGCEDRVYVPFANPEDGQGPLKSGNPTWQRTGTDFETLTVHPSILRRAVPGFPCTWHGWVKNGEVSTC